MQCTRNVQRAGPKARKGSARASLSLSLSLPLSFFSLLLSSLLLIDRNVQRAGPKARNGSARAALSLFFLQYSPFSSLHIISALRSPSLLLTGPESALSARKGSARAFLRVSLLFALLSPLFSSLLLMDRKLYARAKNVAYAGLSSPHFPLLLSLSFSDRARQQTARLRRANWLVHIKRRLNNRELRNGVCEVL